MEFTSAKEEQYNDIARLAASPEELFSFCATGSYPWDKKQIEETAKARKSLTVCNIAGQVVAFSNLYNVVPGESAFIGNVIVGEDFKGQGIGKGLIKHMIEVCKEDYDAVPHLSVFNFNTRALLMYSKLGFEPYSVAKHISPQGENVALIHMRLTQRI